MSDATPVKTGAVPYESLTPDVMLEAIASVGLAGDGRLLPLASYENRVYQMPLEDGQQVVVKFYRPGRWSLAQIIEEHGFAQELADAEIPVVAPLVLGGQSLHHYSGFAFAVYPFRGGRAPELDDPQVLEWIGRFLGRIHAVGRKRGFTARPVLDVETFGYASRDWLLAHEMLPQEVRANWLACFDQAIDLVRRVGRNLKDVRLLRLHGDCHPGNILWRPASGEDSGGPHFVDLDDARMGPAVQDLWMLLSGDDDARREQLGHVLSGYEMFSEFDWRECALIEPLRTLRIIHYSAWLARRWDDPAFAVAFPWFGTSAYWHDQVKTLKVQIDSMQQQPGLI